MAGPFGVPGPPEASRGWFPFSSSQDRGPQLQNGARVCPPPFFEKTQLRPKGRGRYREPIWQSGTPILAAVGRVGARLPRCPAGARPSGSLGLAGEERKEALPSKPSALSQLDKPLNWGGGAAQLELAGPPHSFVWLFIFPLSLPHVCCSPQPSHPRGTEQRRKLPSVGPLAPPSHGLGRGLPFSQGALEGARGRSPGAALSAHRFLRPGQADPSWPQDAPPQESHGPCPSPPCSGIVQPLSRSLFPAALLATETPRRPVGGRKTWKVHRSRSRLSKQQGVVYLQVWKDALF